MIRVLRLLVEFTAAFVAVAAVALMLLAWRVTSQPITLTAVTPYVESFFDHLAPNTKASIERTVVVWDNTDRTLALRADGLVIKDSDTQSIIAEAPSLVVKLDALGLLWGHIRPSELRLAHPRLRLTHHTNGTLSFGGMASAAADEDGSDGRLKEAIGQFVDDMTRGGFLKDVYITSAEITVHNEGTNRDSLWAVPDISLHREGGNLTGHAQVEVQQQDHSALVQAHYAFQAQGAQHRLTVRFSDINPSLVMMSSLPLRSMVDLPLTGEVTLTADQDLGLATLDTKLEGGEGRLVNADLWDQPRTVKQLTLEAHYDRAAQRLSVPQAELDLGVTKVNLTAEGQPLASEQRALHPAMMGLTLHLVVQDLPMDEYAAVWPKPIIPNAREWIAANLHKGQFTRAELTLRGRAYEGALLDLMLDSGEGKLSATGATVTYLDGMPAIENVNAEAMLDLEHMEVNISGGGIGDLKLRPSTIRILDFQKAVQSIVIPVKLAGPVRDVLKLIDAPPLGYAKEVGLKPEETGGQLEGQVELRFPLLASLLMKDVAIKANAQLTDFAAKKLIPGLEVTQGHLALDLDKVGFAVKGTAALNKVPFQVAWKSLFAEKVKGQRAQATISGTVMPEQWPLLGVEIPGRLTGGTAVALRYAQVKKNMALLSGEVNFRQTGVQFDPLGWSKPAGTPATLTFAADLPGSGDISIKSLELKGPNITARGRAVLRGADLGLASLDLQPLIVGRTNANLHITQQKGALQVAADGESLDISGLNEEDTKKAKEPSKPDERPKEFAFRLRRLYTSETGFIDNFSGYARRDQVGWTEMDLHGLANGRTPLDISLQPHGERRVFSIVSNDFGQALKGMGFTDTVKGGALEVTGESDPANPRVIEGRIKIGGFSVSGLPFLARLLSAASPFGFADLLTGETSFNRLQGRFRWLGDKVEVIKVRAAGSAFGINADGHVDLDSGQANLNGTLVPFSFFNSIIDRIPLLGNVITGGEGQGVIAVSYALKGPFDDPTVTVNPVSLLTPGFLRNLFFAGEE